MIEIGIIIVIFIIGFGLAKWLSERLEHRETELKPPYKKEDDENTRP